MIFIGFNQINEDMFSSSGYIPEWHFPISKLKTIDYLYRYQGVMLDIGCNLSIFG